MIVFIVFCIAAIIGLIILASLLYKNHKDSDNLDERKGTQVGGKDYVPLFGPKNERAGLRGEIKVNYYLRSILEDDEYLLVNLLLPIGNGYKTEVDCILISRKGIFCIEIKNWGGHIEGDNSDEYWYQEFDERYMETRKHQNPVKQNESHCDALDKILNKNYDIFNIVIFSNLEDYRGIHSDFTFSIDDFIDYYNNELTPDDISAYKLDFIYRTLLPCVASEEELKKHKEEIRNRFNQPLN